MDRDQDDGSVGGEVGPKPPPVDGPGADHGDYQDRKNRQETLLHRPSTLLTLTMSGAYWAAGASRMNRSRNGRASSRRPAASSSMPRLNSTSKSFGASSTAR